MKRIAKAHWNGDLDTGHGELTTQSLVLNQTQYSFNTRFANGTGSNPEELLAAAHAGCFTMSLAYALSQLGLKPIDLNTTAEVNVDFAKAGLTGIQLILTASAIEGLSPADFLQHARTAEQNCLLSKALTGVAITLYVHYPDPQPVAVEQ